MNMPSLSWCVFTPDNGDLCCSFTDCSSNADAGVLLHLNGDVVTLDSCDFDGSSNGQLGYTGAVEIFGVGSSVVSNCNFTDTECEA